MEIMHTPALLPTRAARLVVTPHPLTLQGQTSAVVVMEDGQSLAAVLHNAGVDEGWVVELDGLQVPTIMWQRTRVKHGVVIECRRAVHNSDTLRTVAFVVLAYYTMGAGGTGAEGWITQAGYTGFQAFAIAATAFYAGSILINRLLPPSTAARMDMATNNVMPTYSLSGGRNSARLWEPMSLVLGQPYVVPDLAGQPWSYFAGEDQYLVQNFHGGINLQSIDQVRIGQTLLSSYEDVTLRAKGLADTTLPSDLPANSVDTIAGALLDAPSGAGEWMVRTTSINTIQIGIDLEIVLFAVDKNSGAYRTWAVNLGVEYCQHGTELWKGIDTGTTVQEQYVSGYTSSSTDGEGNPVGGDPIYSWRTRPITPGTGYYQNASTKPLRVSINVSVPMGQYDVRLRKIDQNNTSTSEQNQVTWTQLKSFQPDLGSYPGQSLVSLTIKASGQLNGSIDQLNWMATAKPMPCWNGSAWVTATNKNNGLSNPGAQILQLARGLRDENGKLIAGLGWPDSRIDIESLKSFMVWCSTMGFTFNAVIQQAMSMGDLLDAVAYAGMGTISWAGGKLGVQWLSDDAPVEGVINMGNIKAKSFSVAYATSDRADEIEYGYFDEAANHQWNSLRVQSPVVDVPVNTARLSNTGITNERHAAILARRAMAENIYMGKFITFEQDLEYLTYRRGTVLALSHDMTQWGYSGRVQAASNDGGTVTLTLDDTIPAPASGSAYMGLRLLGETQYRIFAVQAFAGSTRSVTLASTWPSGVALPGASGNAMDALWVYDFKATPGLKVVVTKIEPGDNQGGAKVTVAPLPDEFWPYVIHGAYTPPPSRSLLQNLPTVLAPRVTEQLNRQGNTYYVDLNLNFTVSGQYKEAEVWGGPNASPIYNLGSTKTNTFKWAGGLGETWSIEIRPKNVFDQYGTSSRLSYEIMGLAMRPSNVVGLSASLDADGVRVRWQKPTDLDYMSTVVRIGESWGSTTDFINESSISSLIGWMPAGLLKLHAKHYDTTGNESAQEASTSIQINAPSQVRIVRSDVQVNTVALGWDDAKTSQPIKSYAIYTGIGGALLADCTLYGKAGSDSRSDVVIFRSAGSKRIYLVAEDVAGNLSVPASIDVNVTLPVNFVLSSEWDANWSGTKTNAYVDDGALFLPVMTTETWADHFSSRGWTTTDDQVAAGYPLVFEPSALSGSYVEQHDIGKLIPSAKISVMVQSTTVSGVVTPSVLVEWSANATTWTAGPQGASEVQAIQVRYVRVTYSVTAIGNDDLIKIRRVHVTVSSEEKAEFAQLDLLATDANGTPYTTTKGFFDVVSAVFTPTAATLGGTSSITTWSIYIDDANSPATPAVVYVMAWDAAYNRVGGRGTLQIGGY